MKKRNYALVLLLLLVTFLAGTVYSQTIFFRNYSVEDGLPFINVSTIFQDSKGNLWSGGYGGLSKFDGISFTNYTPKQGLANHSVSCIIEDNQQNLWIGTIAGINKFDGKKFSTFTTEHGLLSNNITAAVKDKRGNLWFGSEKGISKLSEGTFINFSKKDGLADDYVKCLFCDHNGILWIGTSKGLSSFDGKTFTNYGTFQGLCSADINSIAEDKQYQLWVGTSEGLDKMTDHHFECFRNKEGLPDNFIQAVLVDYKNTVWIGTPKGLSKLENGVFHPYSIKRDQNSNLVACLFQDFENNLWIGTYAGLFKYRGNPFISYGIHDGLSNNFIFGILRDSNHTLWVGSQGGGLFRFDKDEFTEFSEEQGLPAKKINTIFEYKKDELWLATELGLILFNGKTFTRKTDPSGVFDHTINTFFRDSKNHVWIGGHNAVYRYDGEHFEKFKVQFKSEQAEVWGFCEDAQGNIWIGAYQGGLVKYDGHSFSECSDAIGIHNDSFLSLLCDKTGKIYLATLDGLWIYDPATKELDNINKDHGMSSELIYSITFNLTQDQLWIGTNQGLNLLDLALYRKDKTKKVIPFGKQEGFSGVECNSGSYVEQDGCIWFGTVYGLIKYDPKEYIENTSESKISITGFRLFYTDTTLTNKMHLESKENNITFNYTGICLSNPSKVYYSHILEGFEKNWSPPSAERLTTYSNLPPGTYTFKVISSNNEGVWNHIPASFSFTIDRPFYKTWWFIALMTTLILAGLYFSIRFRIRQIKRREKRKTELNNKIAQIESQALRAQMNPHFIFNTLSSIQHYIANNDTDAALKYLSKFAKLMRKIMDNSKQPLIPVSEELNALNLYLELEVMRFEKKFDYSIDVDASIDTNYDQIPSMLIQPYVENAIIHGLLPKDGPGKITINMTRQEQTILCIIEDNGIGRERSKEFKKNRVQQHKSMGMSITQERLDILNSSLNSKLNAEIVDLYENGQPAGTRVRLIIPLESNDD